MLYFILLDAERIEPGEGFQLVGDLFELVVVQRDGPQFCHHFDALGQRRELLSLDLEILEMHHFGYLVVERIYAVVDQCEGLELDEVGKPIRQLADLAILELQYL